MSFYGDEIVTKIDSASTGLQLQTRTNLAATPKANLIISHGLAEYSGRFDPIASYLVKHDYNVFRYDQLGHGGSDGDRGFLSSPTDLSDNLKLVVERVKAKYPDLPLFILGHSMGGETVLLFAAKYPHLVDGMIVTDPASLLEDKEIGMGKLFPIPGNAKDTIPNAIGDGLVSDHRVLEKYKNNPQVLHQLTVGIENTLYQGGLFLRDHIDQITDPILFLHGLADGILSYRDSLTAFEKIASVDKELHVYPFLMHEILNEPSRKWEIYAEIDQWISKRIY
jgi:acylglycerol lipase